MVVGAEGLIVGVAVMLTAVGWLPMALQGHRGKDLAAVVGMTAGLVFVLMIGALGVLVALPSRTFSSVLDGVLSASTGLLALVALGVAAVTLAMIVALAHLQGQLEDRVLAPHRSGVTRRREQVLFSRWISAPPRQEWPLSWRRAWMVSRDGRLWNADSGAPAVDLRRLVEVTAGGRSMTRVRFVDDQGTETVVPVRRVHRSMLRVALLEYVRPVFPADGLASVDAEETEIFPPPVSVAALLGEDPSDLRGELFATTY